MGKNFYKRLNDLATDAHEFIKRKMRKSDELVLFKPSEKDEFENDKGESVFDMPTFQVYDNHGGCEYAHLKKITKDGDSFILTGESKNGGEETVSLHEIDPQDAVFIASYLE